MSDVEEPVADHVLANRISWDADADSWVERGRILWAADEITWGIWGVPESELGLLPDVRGLDVVELGCGTGYVSSWFSRRGARALGLDNSGRQLATARMLQDEFGIRFPLLHADAERAPLRDGTWLCRSTALPSGAIPTDGSPRRRGSCAPAAGWCSSDIPTSRC